MLKFGDGEVIMARGILYLNNTKTSIYGYMGFFIVIILMERAGLLIFWDFKP